MTDELIARLSSDLRPVRPMAIYRLLLGSVLAGTVVSAAVMLVWPGLRPDLAVASGSMMFWSKFIYTLAFAKLGGVASMILARPTGRTRWPWYGALGMLALFIVLAFIQLLRAPDDMMPLVFGNSPMRCLGFVIVFSIPVLIGGLFAMRRLAPASPTLGGLAAGLMAGGTGAWIYSFACAEAGMMFLALWYTLAIGIVAGAGALLGRVLLRW